MELLLRHWASYPEDLVSEELVYWRRVYLNLATEQRLIRRILVLLDSRWSCDSVWRALSMMLVSVLSKVGELFATMPAGMHRGGIYATVVGLIIAVGLSNLQYVDLKRNLFMIGFAIYKSFYCRTRRLFREFGGESLWNNDCCGGCTCLFLITHYRFLDPRDNTLAETS